MKRRKIKKRKRGKKKPFEASQMELIFALGYILGERPKPCLCLITSTIGLRAERTDEFSRELFQKSE
jgi:hypothetical protein